MLVEVITKKKSYSYTDNFWQLRTRDTIYKLIYATVAWLFIIPFYRIFTTLEWLWYGQTVLGSTLVLVLVFLPIVIIGLFWELSTRKKLANGKLIFDLTKKKLTFNNDHYSMIANPFAVKRRQDSWWNWESLAIRSVPYVLIDIPKRFETLGLMDETWQLAKKHLPSSTYKIY